MYVELPEVGAEVERGEQLSVLESVKAVAEVYTSLTGKVTEVNEELENSPNLVNEEPFDNGRYYTPLPPPINFHGIFSWIICIEQNFSLTPQDYISLEKL